MSWASIGNTINQLVDESNSVLGRVWVDSWLMSLHGRFLGLEANCSGKAIQNLFIGCAGNKGHREEGR